MKFELSKKEIKNRDKVFKKLKKKYGMCGYITYCFTPTGIGTCVTIKSSNNNKEYDITDSENYG